MWVPVTNCAMSMMWAPMSPRAPEPASDLSSRQLSGTFSSVSQSCRYCPRTCRMVPSRPEATSRRASATAGVRRYVKPTIERTPRWAADAAAAAIASASSTVLASGFSHMTCLPASSAAIAISAWVLPGVQMSMTSMSSRVSRARQSVSTDAHPKRRATSPAAAASRPQIAVRRGVSGRSKKAGAVRQAWEWAAPMKA